MSEYEEIVFDSCAVRILKEDNVVLYNVADIKLASHKQFDARDITQFGDLTLLMSQGLIASDSELHKFLFMQSQPGFGIFVESYN